MNLDVVSTHAVSVLVLLYLVNSYDLLISSSFECE